MTVGNGTVVSNSNSLEFLNSSDQVILPSDLLNGRSSFTFLADFNANTNISGFSNIIQQDVSFGSPSNNDYDIHIRYEQNNNQFVYVLKIQGVNKSIQIPFPSLQQWHNCAMTYDGTSMKAYLDGNLVGTETLSGSYVSSNADFYLGNWNQQELFEGRIDNPSVWNRALPQSEIQQYMSCPPTGNEAGLVGYWNFNEGSGNTVNDLTSNGNNGTTKRTRTI